MIAALFVTLALADPGTLVLRGNEPAPAGLAVTGVSLAGVALAPADAPAGTVPTMIIGWDRVRQVSGPLSAEASPYQDLADRAWRARTRIERGDWPSAEPLLDTLFPAVRAGRGPTSAVVAEALVRARLARGAHVLAIEPMLVVLAAVPPAGQTWPHERWADEVGLPPLIDPALGLPPALPPIWLRTAALETFAAAASASSASPASTRADLIAAYYTLAARADAGLPTAGPVPEPIDPGTTLLRDMLVARIGSPEARESARTALRARLAAIELPQKPKTDAESESTDPGQPAWVEAWVRAALGRSLAREAPLDRKYTGIVQLLHVPARLIREQPYLAGVALAEASAMLRDLGDADGADRLAAELFQRLPTHPACDWPPLAAARVARPTTQPAPSETDDTQP